MLAAIPVVVGFGRSLGASAMEAESLATSSEDRSGAPASQGARPERLAGLALRSSGDDEFDGAEPDFDPWATMPIMAPPARVRARAHPRAGPQGIHEQHTSQPISADSGPIVYVVDLNSAESVPNYPGPFSMLLAQIGPKSVELAPKSAKFGRAPSNIGRSRTNSCRFRAKVSHARPKLGERSGRARHKPAVR